MDPELKQELDQIHALEKDNHDMLRAIRRDAILGFFGRIIIWLIVLAVPLYFYQQYLQPIVSRFTAASGISTSGSFGLPTSAGMQKLLNSLKAGFLGP